MPRIETSDGTEIFYRDWGAGAPVVFIHGLQMTCDMWQHQMLHLSERGFRAVAYDGRGRGLSDEPGVGYDFDTLADDLATLLERLGLDRATLVGHSMGGGVIVRYLSRHGSGLVSRIALVSSTVPRLEVEPEMRDVLLDRLRTDYGRWVEENAALSFGEDGRGDPISETDKEMTVRQWLGIPLRALLALNMTVLSADMTSDVAGVRLPTLVVHGDNDPFAPLEMCGRRTAELIPGGRLVVYDGAAHMPHLSHRARLGQDLAAFAR